MSCAANMSGKNWRLVADEPVEGRDCRKIADPFGGIYRRYPTLMKESQRI